MFRDYKLVQYSIGEKIELKTKGEGAVLEINNNNFLCHIILKDISEMEIEAVNRGVIIADLCYIDNIAFLCLSIGGILKYELPFNMSVYSEHMIKHLKQNCYLMPIVLVDADTRVVKAMRCIGFNKEFSEMIYKLAIAEWKNEVRNYDLQLKIVFNKYTTDELMAQSIKKQIFFSKYPMKYDRNGLIERIKNGEKLKYRFFWGHKDGVIEDSLSQWYKCRFCVNGSMFTSAEQYMMAQKAALFQDKKTFEMIMDTNDPRKCKALGRKVQGFNDKIWDTAKYKIVLDGNYLKFSLNDELKRFLLSTGDEILVEASPYDKVWGIGMYENNVNATNPALWKGENMLGFALMEARDIIRENEKRGD